MRKLHVLLSAQQSLLHCKRAEFVHAEHLKFVIQYYNHGLADNIFVLLFLFLLLLESFVKLIIGDYTFIILVNCFPDGFSSATNYPANLTARYVLSS